MLDQDVLNETFAAKAKYQFLWWFIVVLLAFGTVFLPFMIATADKAYPDLDLLLTWCSGVGFLWIMLLYESGKHTIRITLEANTFSVKKAGRPARQFPYAAIQHHNERPNSNRHESFSELTIYLPNYWFIVRSNEFADYEYLKAQLTYIGTPISYRAVLTRTERNWLRACTIALAGLIIGNIAFGYWAHNPADPNPAPLTKLTGTVCQVRYDAPKGKLRGVKLCLHEYPAFSFYLSRQDFDMPLPSVVPQIRPGEPADVLIRRSDYRKKITRTQLLTFGDKYTGNFSSIDVFGLTQASHLHVSSNAPAYEPTYTKPRQRAILMAILLLLCWTGWVQIDRYAVL